MLQSSEPVLKNIRGNKIHPSLTILGVIISVTAVTILVNLVSDYMDSMMEGFASMGVNRINISVTNLTSHSPNVDEMYAFYEDGTDLLAQLSPNVGLPATIKRDANEMDSTSVDGCSEQYLGLKEYTIEAGRNTFYTDIMSRQKVCVIETFVAQELHGSAQNTLDQTIKVGGYSLKIVGVVVQGEDDMGDGNTDDFVWPPCSVVVKMSRNAVISSYTFTLVDTNLSDNRITVIEDLLYETFKGDDLYRVTAMSEMLDPLNEQIAMISIMLGGITGISLLIIDVGVMDIALVFVIERIREIRIRKSLGIDKGTIMRQLVIEATVTGPLGRVVGILTSCIPTTLVGTAVGITATFTPAAIAISFSVSVGIGLLFEYMLTNRATSLSPIDALRSE